MHTKGLPSWTLIVEFYSEEEYSVTVLEESSNMIFGRQKETKKGAVDLTDSDNLKPFLNDLLEQARPYVVSAVVCIYWRGIERQGNVPVLINSYRVPVLLVPAWMASAYAISEDVNQFILLDTNFPGQCSLLKRQRSGIIESLGSQHNLNSFLHISEPTPAWITDVLLAALYEYPTIRQSLSSVLDRNTFFEVLDSISINQRKELNAALSSLLDPLARSLYATSLIANFSRIACTTDFPQTVKEAFREIIIERLTSLGTTELPEISFIDGDIIRYNGAIRCIKALSGQPGVWIAHTSQSAQFQLITPHEIRYTVVQPSRNVFDLEENSIIEFVGERPLLAVVDDKVDEIYGASIHEFLDKRTNKVGYVVIEGVESKKKFDQVEKVCSEAIKVELRRDGVIVGIGGGVTLDIAGFAAAIFRRGVSYLRIPTTLIGLVDVGVGVKHAVNYENRKNILGVFYPAIGSINDSSFLKTLGEKDIGCGMAEIIKMGVIRDEVLFQLLEKYGQQLLATHFQEPEEIAKEIMARAEQAMLEELQPNLYELQFRRLVDFGHTFSPTIEIKSNYQIQHGQAVAIDMFLCTFIAVQRKICSREVLTRLINLYQLVGLPIHQNVCDAYDFVAALESVRAHRGGTLNLVIPSGIGEGEFVEGIEYSEMKLALTYADLFKRGDHVSDSL